MPSVDTSLAGFSKYISRVCSEGTAQKYASASRDFLRIVKENGYESFSDFPPGLLNKYVEILLEQDYSASTVHVYVAGVKRYLEWVEGQGVKMPTFARVDMPKKKHVMRDVLTPDMLQTYFDHSHALLQEPVRSAALLLPCTGLRAQEMAELPLAAIRKIDIEIRGETVRTLALRVTGKGEKQRTVPLIGEGSQILAQYLSGYRRIRKGPYLFPGTRGKNNRQDQMCMSTRTLRHALAKVRAPMGLTFTPHTMRRTYLVSLWRKGVDPATIAKIAGHVNIQTLFQHYLALDEQDVVRAVEMASRSKEDF